MKEQAEQEIFHSRAGASPAPTAAVKSSHDRPICAML